ncbi:MAG: hypothetical protein B5M55_08590 [Desulfococcus sp. 4484_242]|nr:MAG: hypothetical protein B5M55_08590 [Desulfococcus sp. 4484_242]
MRMILTALRKMKSEDTEGLHAGAGFMALKVLYCAICRTDAKIWNEGHRDMIFPRVLGHELVAEDEQGKRFTVWPGKVCGKCRHCQGGRENLCEDIEIMGFHYDGGFANHVLAPDESLVPVPDDLPSPLACFAEPAGCAVHAIEKLSLKKGERMVIYGGGTVGLIAALAAMEKGAIPLVIEKSEEKIHKSRPFLEETGIECVKDTTDAEFHAALNACPDHAAFSLCVVKLGKGGRLSFFSGLTKNKNIETNLINLMHYKEIELFGAYGLAKKDMKTALSLIKGNTGAFEKLIEGIVPAQMAPQLLPEVLTGRPLKYILDFSGTSDAMKKGASSGVSTSRTKNGGITLKDFKDLYRHIIEDITPVPEGLLPMAQTKIDNKTKPLGSLGKLEDIALRLCLIQQDLEPRIERKSLFVFAADHGITEEGVSAYPVETIQAIQNGMEIFLGQYGQKPIDIIGLGDMGIGNTTCSSAIISAVTGISPAQAAGRGTGIDDKALEHKAEVIQKALAFHRPNPRDGIEILRKVGGYEIAGMAGAVLAAASKKTAVVLDGVISTAGGLIAYLINPDIRGYLFSGHKSVEPAHKIALTFMELEPVLDLNMRLGEGTGAALTIDLIEAAARIMREMASFDEAGVSKRGAVK